MKKLLIIITLLLYAGVAFAGQIFMPGPTVIGNGLDMLDTQIEDVGYIDMNLDDGIPCMEGRLTWNDTDGTLNICLKGGTVNLQTGQEQVVRGKNTTGSGITNATPVRIGGVSGSNPEWGLSNAADPSTAGSIGILTEDISNNQFGFVTTFGLVRELDTTGTPVGEVWNDGDRIYVGNTSGELTNVAPTGSERKIFIGIVFNANANEGIIWVNPINVSYFNELSGPLLTNGSVVFINSSGMTVEDTDNFVWDDSNNRLGIGIKTPTQPLDINGVSFFRDSIAPYAEFEFHDHDNPLTIALGAGGAFVNITGLVNGVFSDGMVLNPTDGSVTVTYGGVYKYDSSFSIQDPDGNSEEYNGTAGIDGVGQEKCEWHRDITVLSSEGVATISCLLDVPPGGVVTSMVNSVGGDDAGFEALNWNLTR